MTIDSNLANWNKENEPSPKTVRFADPDTPALYKTNRKTPSRSASSSPTQAGKSPKSSKSPKSPKSPKRVEAENAKIKWKKIREKFATEEEAKTEEELVDEMLKLCSFWTLPEYTEDLDLSSSREEDPFERYMRQERIMIKRKSPYRGRIPQHANNTTSNKSNTATSDLPSSPKATTQPLPIRKKSSFGLSSLRLDSKVFTDPDWCEKDEDSQSSVDSGYKSDFLSEPTLQKTGSIRRQPFGQVQTRKKEPIVRLDSFNFDMAIKNAEENLSKIDSTDVKRSSETKKPAKKPFGERQNSPDFWSDMNHVDF